MTTAVSDSSFDVEVGASPEPVVLEFFATWCGNCLRIAPVLKRLAVAFAGQVRFVKVDVEENPDLVARFGVSSTPTLLALVGGESLAEVVGAQAEPVLRELFVTAASRAGRTAFPTWVPAEACTLPTAEQPLRLAEFDDLFAAALRTVERLDTDRLRLRLSNGAGVEDTARDLTAREANCCDFFIFDVRGATDAVDVDVRVPPERTSVLDGLERQALAAVGGSPR